VGGGQTELAQPQKATKQQQVLVDMKYVELLALSNELVKTYTY